jgi:catechol 2,3-dioxygenase-like lactoylglutathione lyase family enzyme
MTEAAAQHTGAMNGVCWRTDRTPGPLYAALIKSSGRRGMLRDCDAIAVVAVADLASAAAFYEGTLGLSRLSTEGEEAITYRSGSTRLNVYRSQFARTNKATSVMWNVGKDIEAVAAHLAAKGVRFEQYDMPGMAYEQGIYSAGGMKVAWFKDPDGNVLSLVGEA